MLVLDIKNLSLSIANDEKLSGVSLALEKGRILGLVGASGSGKSLTTRAIMGLPPQGASLRGEIMLAGRSLLSLDDAEMNQVRGREIGIIFQDSASAFDPLLTVGDHLAEPLRHHLGLDRKAARQEAQKALDRVEFPTTIDAFDRYPHEISGGQRQRAMIAVAVALKPKLLLADEPTTALDVTTQAAILDLFKRLKEEGMAILLVSHDLPALATIADDLALMEKGVIVETMATRSLHDSVGTKLAALFASAIPGKASLPQEGGEAVMTASHLSYAYGKRRVLNDVSFTLRQGECIGVVGESGSGKSTLAKIVTGLAQSFLGHLNGPKRVGSVQMVFQDPIGAFNPRWQLGRSIAEPLGTRLVTPDESNRRVVEVLAEVGLGAQFAERYPHDVSGGQAQRAAIARAIIAKPDVLVLDEPVSALDVAVRGQILELLDTLRVRHGLAMLFITHDLGVARTVANRVLVMQSGSVVEEGLTSDLLTSPSHPYTLSLVRASPKLGI